uniref:Uncharacterized protein n=1 Tax=Cannabis sativa TaxID=3483 RepID=A0A803Q257_CANSA
MTDELGVNSDNDPMRPSENVLISPEESHEHLTQDLRQVCSNLDNFSRVQCVEGKFFEFLGRTNSLVNFPKTGVNVVLFLGAPSSGFMCRLHLLLSLDFRYLCRLSGFHERGLARPPGAIPAEEVMFVSFEAVATEDVFLASDNEAL